jgi:hypothetical protein
VNRTPSWLSLPSETPVLAQSLPQLVNAGVIAAR